MAHPIYHLDLQVTRCRIEARLNGMPAAELASPDAMPASFAPPINPYLAGELNLLDITIFPVADASGALSGFFDAGVKGWVRRYEKGDIVAPSEGPAVTELGIPDDLVERVREEELELPQSFTHVFANDVVDFSELLSKGPVVDDDSALLDYAMHLRDLTAQGSVSGLMTELEPKILAWVEAYDEPRDAFAESLESELTELMAEQPLVDFERDDVDLASCAGGRVWELRRSGEAFLGTDVLEDGSRSEIRVFVAPVDGAFRVVR